MNKCSSPVAVILAKGSHRIPAMEKAFLVGADKAVGPIAVPVICPAVAVVGLPWGQRRPIDMEGTCVPGHRTGIPENLTRPWGHPEPPDPRAVDPAAIVKGHPSPGFM